MSERRYTAQEMREMSSHLIADICDTENECNEYRNAIGSFDLSDCEYALRQAADAEDENAKLREENAKLTSIINAECNKCGDCAKFGNDCTAGDVDGNEDCRACEKFVPKDVARLKARLEAVVKECEKVISHYDKVFLSQPPITLVIEAKNILRVARGEGDAK